MTSSRDLLEWNPPDLFPRSRWAAEPAAPATSGAAWSLPEIEVAGRTAVAAPRRTEADEAYERGRAEGQIEGEQRARERLGPALDAVARVAESFEIIAQAWVCDRERDLEGLALAVARKLVQRELTADPMLVRDLIARGIELMPADTALEIRLHPDDLAAIRGELEVMTAGSPSLRWSTDAALARGDFMVENPVRVVDGRTDVALHTLYERLDQS